MKGGSSSLTGEYHSSALFETYSRRHSGGQCVQVTGSNGKSTCVLAADQSPEDARVDTLLQAYKNRTPLVLIAGEGYEQLPWKIGCAYAVLGWCAHPFLTHG